MSTSVHESPASAQQSSAPTRLSAKKKEEYKTAARGLIPLIYPFGSVQNMLQCWRDGHLENAAPPTLREPVNGQHQRRFVDLKEYKLFFDQLEAHHMNLAVNKLFERFPGLQEHLTADEDVPFISAISEAVSKTRSTHTNNVKWDIFSFLSPSDDLGLGFEVPAKLTKSERGMKHFATARFLVPRNLLEQFEENPKRIIDLLEDTSTYQNRNAEEWPTFLYDEQMGWSKKNIRNGLFRGHVLARVAIRIFRNNTAAKADQLDGIYDRNQKAKGPLDLLSKHNIKEITPQMIAYAAVQTYFALSTMASWGYEDRTFDLRQFYHIIVDSLSTPGSKWVDETMDWWQRKLFGDGTTDDTEDPWYELTTKSAYMMMRMQDKEAFYDSDDEEGLEDSPSYPGWAQWKRRKEGLDGNNDDPDISEEEDENNQGDQHHAQGAEGGDDPTVPTEDDQQNRSGQENEGISGNENDASLVDQPQPSPSPPPTLPPQRPSDEPTSPPPKIPEIHQRELSPPPSNQPPTPPPTAQPAVSSDPPPETGCRNTRGNTQAGSTQDSPAKGSRKRSLPDEGTTESAAKQANSRKRAKTTTKSKGKSKGMKA